MLRASHSSRPAASLPPPPLAGGGGSGWQRRWWERCLRATDPRSDIYFFAALLGAETVLCGGIIFAVPYTEIDWTAYMEQVAAYQGGERDYAHIRGGTGPLVYPAGFLYLFALFRSLTKANVRAAQYIFAGLYLATQACVWGLYQQAIVAIRQRQRERSTPLASGSREIWSWRIATACTCLSKRVHSIFLLRLFNDGPTMLLLYAAMYLFTRHRWNAGCVIFSLAVSQKMNVLLFAPGLLLLLLQVSSNMWVVLLRLLVCCALPQLILGAPFLLAHPISYLRKAFELDRVFFFKWTVNWKVRRVCAKY